jgi:hypothetical protein
MKQEKSIGGGVAERDRSMRRRIVTYVVFVVCHDGRARIKCAEK